MMHASRLRVLSWNVNKRRDVVAQCVAIVALKPDVIVLQEVNARTWPQHREALAAGGLSHAASALDMAPINRDAARALPSFVAVASCWPVAPATPAMVPAPEAIACVTVDSVAGPFDVIGVHVPTFGGRKDRLLKVETQEGLLERLATVREPTLLCGDFNSPFSEMQDGTVTPFARQRGSRQRLAEAALMGASNSHHFVDLFRAVHGYDAEAHSWYWKNRERTGGYRLDHIFGSREFSVLACDYIHDWRIRRMSDHSAIYADVVLRRP